MIKVLLCLMMLGRLLAGEAKPHPVPSLEDLQKPWLFARASEASTLFIEPHFKTREPFALVIKTKNLIEWVEFDGESFEKWTVSKVVKSEKDLTLHLEEGGRVLAVPYWDIDHCLLMIRFSPNKDTNPTRFAVPYSLLPKIPYAEAEE